MELPDWKKILIIWVNSLALLKIQDIDELCNGDVIIEIIDLVLSTKRRNTRIGTLHLSNIEFINSFFKDEFPNLNNGQLLDLYNINDIVIMTSCLMFLSSVTYDIPKVKEALLKLNHSLQSSITNFFQMFMETNNVEMERVIVERVIRNIPECDLNIQNYNKENTPMRGQILRIARTFSTNSRTSSPINVFFESPLMQRNLLSEKVKEIAMLKKQLDEEEDASNKLREMNNELKTRVKEIQTKVKEIQIKNQELEARLDEIHFLKSRIEGLENAHRIKTTSMCKKEKTLENEIQRLETYAGRLEFELRQLKKQSSNDSEELIHAQNEKEFWFESFLQSNEENKNMKLKIGYLEEHYVELQKSFEFQSKTIHDLKMTKEEKEIIAVELPKSLEFELQNQKLSEMTIELEQNRKKCVLLEAMYNEKLSKVTEDHEKKLQQYKENKTKDQDYIAQLSSQLWDTSDKLLLMKQEVEQLKSTSSRQELKTKMTTEMAPPTQTRSRTNTLDQMGVWGCESGESSQGSYRRFDDMGSVDDSSSYARRGALVVPSGSGEVFPAEDEVFSDESDDTEDDIEGVSSSSSLTSLLHDDRNKRRSQSFSSGRSLKNVFKKVFFKSTKNPKGYKKFK